jgi:hypothetical protein
MAIFWIKLMGGIKGSYSRFRASSSMTPFPDKNSSPLPAPTPEEVRKSFRETLTDYVAGGWTIEIENEFDAVISKKPKFQWFLKLIIFLFLLLVFAPLAVFYLLVVLIRGLTARPRRIRIWVDPDGKVQTT